MHDTISECPHSHVKERFCCRCGIYCEKNMGVYGLKKVCLERQNLGSSQMVDKMRHSQFDLSMNKDYFSSNQQNLASFTKIYHICDQIHANYHTKILSLYIFWHSHHHQKTIQQKDILLAIFIAIKFQQSYVYLRNRNKINSRLLFPLLQSREIQQYELIYQEMEMIQKINFKLKIVSFVDFLEFYVNSGVMFTNQRKKSSDYDKIIHYLEFQTRKYIETGLFFSEPNQQYLALRILYQARKKCGGIDQIWNWHIEYITKTKKDMIDKLIKEKNNSLYLKEITFNSNKRNVQNSCINQQKNKKTLNPVKFGQNLPIIQINSQKKYFSSINNEIHAKYTSLN